MTTSEVGLLQSYLKEMEDRMESRLYTVESRINMRLDDVSKRMTGLEQRMGNVEYDVKALKAHVLGNGSGHG